MWKWLWKLLLVSMIGTSCGEPVENVAQEDGTAINLPTDTLTRADTTVLKEDTANLVINPFVINTGNVTPADLINYANTLVGVPYKYGSTDPSVGFDCSGFITYVFNHFRIQVPRSSIDFTDVGRTIPFDSAKPGDLVLFTGTDSTEKFVGHMGIITSNENGKQEFIHSTSGKQYSVTITPLNNYYMSRYVRTARIFKANDR